MMKHVAVTVLLAISLCRPLAAQADGQPQESSALAELMDALFAPTAAARARAMAALQGYGLDVLPAVAKRLEGDAATAPLAELLLRVHTANQEQQARQSSGSGAQVEGFLREQLTYARGLLENRDLPRALEVVEAILTVAPQGAARTQAAALRRQIRDQLVRETVVKGELVTAGDRFAINEIIEVQLRLTNTGDGALIIPRSRTSDDGQVAESTVIATIVYRIYDPAGNMRSLSDTRRISIDRDIEIQPGGVWTTSFRIDAGQNHATVQAVRTYSISALLRPVEVQLPTETIFRPIAFAERTLEVFPLGWEQVATEPLTYLGSFIRAGALHETAVVSWLVPEAAAPGAVDLLVGGLVGADEYSGMVFMSCLERITGEDHGREAAAWIHWWQNVGKEWKPK